MRAKAIAITITVVVLAVLVGGYFLLGRRNSASTNNTSGTASDQTAEEKVENSNIFSLTDGGRARQCNFSYSGTSGNGEGKMYTDGKGRGLMTIDINTSKGNTGKNSTLLLNDKVYGWSNTGGKTVGFVYNKSSLTTSSGSASSTSTVDPNQKFNLKCSSWSVDESMLSVPSDINFMSLPGM